MKPFIFKAISLFILLTIIFPCKSSYSKEILPEQPQQNITINAKDIEIADAIKLVSEKSSLNVIIGKEIRGKTSFFLENISPRNALIALARVNDLSCSFFEDNVILLNSNEAENFRKKADAQKDVTTIILQLKNIQASKLTNSVSRSSDDNIKLSVLTGINCIAIKGHENAVQRISNLITNMDKNISTRVYPVNHAPLEALKNSLTKRLTEGIGSIQIDNHSNSLIITDLPDIHKKISSIIKKTDKLPLQVSIEAKIVQVILSDENITGINWDVLIKRSKELSLKTSFSSQNENNSPRINISSLSARTQVETIIDLLKSKGEVNLLSQPTLTVMDKEKAKILVGENRAYVTTTTTLPSSGISNTAEQVNFIKVGVKLFVTPRINGENTITMNIRPEVSSVSEILTTASGNSIPIIQTSEAETIITARNNETIIIGGLIKEEETETVNAVPVVEKAPLIGRLFKNREKTTKKTELVIFITASIKENL